MSRLRSALRVLPILALALTVLSPALATQSRSTSTLSRDTAIALLQEGNNSLVLNHDQQTGIPNFVAGTLPEVTADVATPLEAARAFFAEQAGLFRMRNPGEELSLVRDERDGIGMNHVRFQQRYNGVEVFGGMMIAHTRGTRIESVSGTYFPDISVETKPGLTFAQAVERARAAIRAPDATVTEAGSGLAIYARSRHPALTWKIELLSMSAPGRWLVFVNAGNGGIVHRINMLHTAKLRETYIAGGTDHTDLPGTKVCSDAPLDADCGGDAVAQAAHDYAGTVYDYYFSKFGRDSIDGAGMIMKSTVHFAEGYNNAFWNGSQMVYGDGDGELFSPLSQSLDIVAHELTHGVTDFSADLVYEDESGALNESYSDVLGVFADAYGRGSISADWALAEGAWTPGIAGDALRDMADPHKGNDPFTNGYNCTYRPGQPYYCGQPASFNEFARLPISIFEDVPSDTGGVHVNSGIPNKIAYLITDGGTFNGISVTALGVAKTEQIYYRTLVNYLAPYSNFLDARNASIQSCADLVGQFGITAGDCTSVRDAFAAAGIGPRASLTRQVYLPSVLAGATSVKGFTGRVTLNGGAVGGVVVELLRCDTRRIPTCSVAAMATTSSTGSYAFPAGASLPNTDDFTWYRVYYENPSAAPNGRMLGWVGDDILTYVQGDTIRLDTFDIGDVTFVAPNNSTPQSFPVTFTWNARPVGGDYYFWELYDDVFGLIAQAYPFLMNSAATFTVNSSTDPQLLPGSSFGDAAYWDVVVVSRAGWGLPYNSGVVSFGGLANQTEALAARRALFERYAHQAHPQFELGR